MKNKKIKTKPAKKKKKVGKFDETCPKNFLARSEKKKFFASETLRLVKARNCELQSSQFNNNNKKIIKTGQKKKKVGKFDETRPKKI